MGWCQRSSAMKDYWQLGYIPYPESGGSTAQTLEHAYNDWCGYELARMTGNQFYQDVFSRVRIITRMFDPSVGFMKGRKIDGSWVENFDKYEWGGADRRECLAL